MARLRWAMSLPGLIGLLASVPAVMLAGGYGITGSDTASVFCILWILKLGLHAPAFGTLARVISNERAPIASVLILFVIVLMIAATAAHICWSACASPTPFGSLPSALWWAVVTLTTTGYGDVVPLTVGGTMIGSVLMISGITVLALMTGVLATGFAQEERRREYLRVWEQVARGADLRLAGRRHPVGDRGQAADALLPAAHHRGAARRSRQFDVLHLRAARSRSACPPAASVRLGEGALLRRDGPARTPAAQRHGGDHASRPRCWSSMPATSTRSPRISPRSPRRSRTRRERRRDGESRTTAEAQAMTRRQKTVPDPGRHRHWPGPHLRLYRGPSRGSAAR